MADGRLKAQARSSLARPRLEAPTIGREADVSPDEGSRMSADTPPARSAGTWKRQLFAGCYFTVCAIAMIGWLIALGWAAITFAMWMFV
jgi:hypothetical protein